ncbi:hypothetical protein TanjilG_25396 [Lupinus angustifolius]|uniref:Uncharacterized protein n=1 Tax=Lupinus angustifolius TaxID=3871 RepID=A0A1J7HRU0_LUPAN|nr:hypothetical protein TanjilG_25396 [Lupinus angustifolius]
MQPLQILKPPNCNGGAAVVDAPSYVSTYRVWEGSNEFLLRGRLIFGPDVKYTFITIFLIVAPIAIFSVFVARKLDNLPPNSGYSILIVVIVHTVFVLTALLLTSARDPGIVPRNAHAPEPEEYDECANIFPEQSLQRHLPRAKDSTYENIKNRYDRQVNPFNKGVGYNFKEIFCSTIPPSKNNFRSKVTIQKDPSDSSQRKGVESLRSLMRKTRGDLELGRSVYNEVYEKQNDSKDGFTSEDVVGNGSGFSDISVELIKMLHMEGGEREVASFLRDSLWERSSRRRNLSLKTDSATHTATDSATHIAIDSASGPSGDLTKVAP